MAYAFGLFAILVAIYALNKVMSIERRTNQKWGPEEDEIDVEVGYIAEDDGDEIDVDTDE
jgi:hypothetical protein